MTGKPILPPLARRQNSSEDRVLPLINVVFLLLIFFMIAGKLIQEPPFELVPATTAHAEAQSLQPGYLAVGSEGQLAWQGKSIGREQLGQTLKTREHPDSPLQVRADLNLDATVLTDLLLELRGHGIAQVQLLTRHQP